MTLEGPRLKNKNLKILTLFGAPSLNRGPESKSSTKYHTEALKAILSTHFETLRGKKNFLNF